MHGSNPESLPVEQVHEKPFFEYVTPPENCRQRFEEGQLVINRPGALARTQHVTLPLHELDVEKQATGFYAYFIGALYEAPLLLVRRILSSSVCSL